MTETIAAGQAQGEVPEEQPAAVADLRRTGIHPDFWYPLARVGDLPRGRRIRRCSAASRSQSRAARTAACSRSTIGARTASTLCTRAWSAAIACAALPRLELWRRRLRSPMPYLPKGVPAARGVRATRAAKPTATCSSSPATRRRRPRPFPDLPEFDSAAHKTMTFSRTVDCHYSFMHENLLDMNHQFLHRGILGKIQPKLLGYDSGPESVEARYLFTHVGGKKNRGANLLAAEGIGGSKSPDVITISTGYPYQTLRLVPENAELPAFSLWVAYVPEEPRSAPTTCTACS